MKQYRVTKYNPEYRNADGTYNRSEWTSYSDVGDIVSIEEYEKVENSYIETALNLLEEQQISKITITYLENQQNYKEPSITLETGTELNTNQLKNVLKSILREKYWAKLENDNSFIHLGWDYYMYIGVPNEPQKAKKYAESNGLYVELFNSPYNENEL
jgi:hypothetical protein